MEKQLEKHHHEALGPAHALQNMADALPALGIVAAVLGDTDLRTLWEQELAQMRERIKAMRVALVEKIAQRVPGGDHSFVTRQRGMFSYSGLTKQQVDRLREEFAIYAVDSGRICVAALNTRNIDYVADGIAKVIG